MTYMLIAQLFIYITSMSHHFICLTSKSLQFTVHFLVPYLFEPSERCIISVSMSYFFVYSILVSSLLSTATVR